MWQLITELSGQVLHTGTYQQCEMIRDAMIRYGIRKDKLNIEWNVQLVVEG